MPVKTTPIYEVRAYNFNTPTRLCRTPEEAATTLIKSLSPKEKKAINPELLVGLIRGMTKGHDHNLYGCRIAKKTLFG